jgi:hypothetical protein
VAAQAAPASEEAVAAPVAPPHTGSLSRRMMLIAAGWITILLLGGGIGLDRTLSALITRQFDEQLNYTLTAMITSAEIDPTATSGSTASSPTSASSNRAAALLADQRQGHDDYPSRSLWDRTLKVSGRSRARSRLLRFAPVSRRAAARVERRSAARQRRRLAVHRRRARAASSTSRSGGSARSSCGASRCSASACS